MKINLLKSKIQIPIRSHRAVPLPHLMEMLENEVVLHKLTLLSALLAVPMAKRFGLINTMVFTHIPSSIFLILIPLMPNLPLAITVLLLRFSISQMDVPTRQSYTMVVVAPDERSAASGVTSIARSIGAAISPSISGIFLGIPSLLSIPFFLM